MTAPPENDEARGRRATAQSEQQWNANHTPPRSIGNLLIDAAVYWRDGDTASASLCARVALFSMTEAA